MLPLIASLIRCALGITRFLRRAHASYDSRQHASGGSGTPSWALSRPSSASCATKSSSSARLSPHTRSARHSASCLPRMQVLTSAPSPHASGLPGARPAAFSARAPRVPHCGSECNSCDRPRCGARQDAQYGAIGLGARRRRRRYERSSSGHSQASVLLLVVVVVDERRHRRRICRRARAVPSTARAARPERLSAAPPSPPHLSRGAAYAPRRAGSADGKGRRGAGCSCGHGGRGCAISRIGRDGRHPFIGRAVGSVSCVSFVRPVGFTRRRPHSPRCRAISRHVRF